MPVIYVLKNVQTFCILTYNALSKDYFYDVEIKFAHLNLLEIHL